MNNIHQILQQYWGYAKFRPLQEEIINSVLSKTDTLALLPTGGGKSICYQVPGIALDGLCLVISPLIALMKDQEQELLQKGIRAAALISGMSSAEISNTIDNCIHGNFKFLFVSPERLSSESFIEKLIHININLIAVDESHCISQWGYDFRPPYIKIASIRNIFPQIPVLALTASATPEVKNDIISKLDFKKYEVYTKSFARPNISYVVRKTDDKHQELLKILSNVKGTAIIYVRNRKKTQDVSMFLQSLNISADFYHAGLEQKLRTDKQEKWKSGKTRIIVATNAFGMGINKADVRVVIHLDLPDDLESYYQEAGRAGRDEKQAYAIILYSDVDINTLKEKINKNFPERDRVIQIYKAILNYFQIPVGSGLNENFDFDILDFTNKFKLDSLNAYQCIKILELEGLISLSESFYNPSRLKMNISYNGVYIFQVKNPAYDLFIKTLLRSYAGLFEYFSKINEKDIAQKLKITLQEVKNNLMHLDKLGVINYIPSTNAPQLTFLENRFADSEIKIKQQTLEDRKSRFEIRANAMINYVLQEHKCRSLMIISYFGEENLTRCGNCDYCRERNKINLNELEFINLKELIIEKIKNSGLNITEIAIKFPGIKTEKISSVIRVLIDENKIEELTNGELQLIN